MFGAGVSTYAIVLTCLSALIFVITLSNYKQLSYWARGVMAMTLIVMISLFTEVSVRYFAGSPQPNKNYFELEPFYPNFMDFFINSNTIYEGIPLLPSLYANARRHKNFGSIMTGLLTANCAYIVILAPLAVITYGDSLREMVLLNLHYGDVARFTQLIYAIALAYNSGANLLPVIDAIISKKEKYPNNLFLEIIAQPIFVRIWLVALIIGLTAFSNVIYWFMLIAGWCFFVIQIILPAYMAMKLVEEVNVVR